jgi:hypothetical protein
MAIVIVGNDLVNPVLQSGWTVVADGFGLNTSVSVYKGDTTTEIDTFLVKGTPHPDPAYTYLKLDKWRISWDSLDVCTITVDYVGIDPGSGEGPGATFTTPNISGANGLTSEPLTSHPNFFTNPAAAGFTGTLAGPGPYALSPLGPIVNSKTTPTKPQQSYIGANGACFESQNGGRFIGFVDPATPSLYGKTNYLATTTTYSGVMYSSVIGNVQSMLALLNSASSTATWGVFPLLPAWAPTGTVVGVGHVNLLSQVNVEEFGSLYKINYEIRYSKTGWSARVYSNIAVGP